MNLFAKSLFLIIWFFTTVNIKKVQKCYVVSFDHSILLFPLGNLSRVSNWVEQIRYLKHSCYAKNLFSYFPLFAIYKPDKKYFNLLEFKIVAAILGSIGSSTNFNPISLVSCASSSKAPKEYKTSRLRIKFCLLGGHRKSKLSKFLIPSAFSCKIN